MTLAERIEKLTSELEILNNIHHTKKNGERVIYKRRHYERLRCNNARRKHKCSNNALYDYKVIEGSILDNLGALLVDEETHSKRTNINREHVAELSRQIDVKTTKLAHLIENLALGSKSVGAYIVGLAPGNCIAIEDSENGLAAARASGIATVVTPSRYTRWQDFSGAALVRDDLDEPGPPVEIAMLESLIARQD
jgi:hypothetical protein